MRHPLLVIALAAACSVQAQNFTLQSKDVGGQATSAQVFNGFGCTGENRSPALEWRDAPAGTKSFAVTMYDPDAPTGSGFWHWVVYDIPASTSALPTGAGAPDGNGLPTGATQGRTDFGTTGYGGPCPPPGHGAHRYIVTVYALRTEKLGVDPSATAALIGFNLNAQALAKASLLFYYER